jgi:hypothetical protein
VVGGGRSAGGGGPRARPGPAGGAVGPFRDRGQGTMAGQHHGDGGGQDSGGGLGVGETGEGGEQVTAMVRGEGAGRLRSVREDGCVVAARRLPGLRCRGGPATVMVSRPMTVPLSTCSAPNHAEVSPRATSTRCPTRVSTQAAFRPDP